MKYQGSQTAGRRSRRGSRRRRPGGGDRGQSSRGGGRPAKKKEGFFAGISRFFSNLFGSKKKPLPKLSIQQPTLRKSPERSNAGGSGGSSNSNNNNNGGSRKPEMVEVTTPRLYVGNLSYDATESDLFELFNGVGHVQNAEVVSHKQTQRSKGFAFVQMQTVEEAKRAVEVLHDKEFLGRKLVVSGAKLDARG
jgi:hypothetical protein